MNYSDNPWIAALQMMAVLIAIVAIVAVASVAMVAIVAAIGAAATYSLWLGVAAVVVTVYLMAVAIIWSRSDDGALDI